MSDKKSKNKEIAILGYGSQGRSIALNLRDSGYHVTIGLAPKSKSRRKAKADGFTKVVTTSEAAKIRLCLFALPDHVQGNIFEKKIKPNLVEKSTLIFLHGFSIHFGFVKPPKECDVIMIAPHAPGKAVREIYLTDKSISAFYAVHQNFSKKAEKTVFSVAKAIGFQKKHLVKATFEHEALGDLFGEQAVLCGGLSELIMSGFDTLVINGIPEENAYLEVAYQLDLIVQLIKQHGIGGMYQRISTAARYGSVYAGEKIIDKSVKKRMSLLFKEIKSGKFAAKLNNLSNKEIHKLDMKISKKVNPAFEKAAKKYSK